MKIEIYTDPRDIRTAKLTVGLRFFNNTQHDSYLFNPYLLHNGELLNAHFQFEPRDSVRYIGPAVKPRFTEEDIAVLGPQQSIYTEYADLRRYYKFAYGKESHFSKFRYRYSAPHPLDAEGSATALIESNWVSVNPNSLMTNWQIFEELQRL